MRLRWAAALVILAIAFGFGCSSGQRLESITVTPTTVVFGGTDPGLHAQLTAMGTYSHPPATKDITNQVTWSSSVTQVAQVTSTGLVSPNTDCGVSGITATLTTNNPSGNAVTGSMSVTVDGPAGSNCPTSTP